jgi:hypothetical protein
MATSKLTAVDSSLDHLYPSFREALELVLAEVGKATGETWHVVEGYRSAERQLWLYAQGRTRPGKIVTWKRSPTWHGTGLAADVAPMKSGYAAPRSYWETLRTIYQKHGLDNPAWKNGDLGHIQRTDAKLRLQSLQWVRNGFPPLAAPAPAPPAPEIRVFVGDELIEDADAFLKDGHLWAWVRPLADAFDWNIVGVEATYLTLVDSENRQYHVACENRGGHSYIAVRDLPAKLVWDGTAKKAVLSP